VKIIHILVISVIAGIMMIPSTPVFSEDVKTIVVPAGYTQTLTFNLNKDAKFTGSVSVSGGNSDINFWVANPTGDHIIPKQGVYVGKSFQFEAESNGGYTLNFDNSFSLVTSKTVTLTYKIEKPILAGGGCLIATATHDSEFAPQIQLLRELRDNKLIQTKSGSSFMTAFNAIYYTFSPTIADWERQNPLFKEIVKIMITPMLSTLSILNYIDIESEQDMLGYGIGIIMLNLGMYFVIPAIIILKLWTRFF
jgi:hypothetical protein